MSSYKSCMIPIPKQINRACALRYIRGYKILTAFAPQTVTVRDIPAFINVSPFTLLPIFSPDDRIILFQKECLRLRKALQSQGSASRDARSVNTNDRSTSPTGTPLSSKFHNQAAKTPISQGGPVATSTTPSVHSIRTMSTNHRPAGSSVSPTPPSARSQSGARSVANTSTVITEARTSMTHSQPIYAWEEGNERAERIPLDIGGVTFLPSKQVGFYNRQDTVQAGFDSTPLPDKYVDFQIILSAEELTTLASRKKAASTRLVAMKGNQQSLHCSTPYVDPRRIYKDHLRPSNPDRWISSEGLRPYKRSEKL
jgi:hypothetical protein